MPSPTFAPGHDLVGRYRIIELLGVGRTAEVYTAEDLSLRRTVVVKVLLASLAAYEDVRREFRDRIVRAATLSHPHLERVYDGGQSSGAIFMVTEYLSGGSLENVLASGRLLDTDDTARLGRDVSGALAYVHANGFVMGSLSPSSLLFDDEGRVRVSDVALAGLGAMHDEPLTYDAVRYLSPEQALGEPAEPKSDVYALALILFEAATGTSPFEATSAEAMLRVRITTPLPVRAELGTLDMLLAQAAVPDPRLRLDAEQFANRLSSAVSDGRPLVVAPIRDQMPLLAQFTPTEPRTSIGFRAPSAAQITGSTPHVPAASSFERAPAPRTIRSNIDRSPQSIDSGYRAPGRPQRSNFDDLPPRPPRGRRVAFAAAAILLVIVAAVGGVVWKFGLLSTKHTVPSLVGLTISGATTALTDNGGGFTLTVSHAYSATTPKHKIVSQSPVAGTTGSAGLAIAVTVSDGTRPVAHVIMPTNLVGKDCATATSQLAALHVVAQCPSSAAITSPSVAAGKIVKVLYHATTDPKSVLRGATVTLVLSTGPGTTTTTTTLAGTTTTTLAGTTTTSTTTTTVAVNTLVAVPNVAGLTRAQVFAAMHTAGLYFSTKGPGAGTSKWTTGVSTVPAAGTKVKRLSTVIVNVK